MDEFVSLLLDCIDYPRVAPACVHHGNTCGEIQEDVPVRVHYRRSRPFRHGELEESVVGMRNILAVLVNYLFALRAWWRHAQPRSIPRPVGHPARQIKIHAYPRWLRNASCCDPR